MSETDHGPGRGPGRGPDGAAVDAASNATPAEPDAVDVGAPDADAPADRTDDDRDGPPARWPRARAVLPWVLVALAVALAAVSTWQWQQLAAAEQQREEVAESAGAFMLTLTNWDAADGMAGTRQELRSRGTERFAGEVDELFGTTEDLRGLEEIGARSDGEVRRLFVQEIEDDRALALVVLRQRLETDVTDGEEVSVRYAELDLLQRDAGWLVDEVELLVDVGQQEAEPIAPEDPDEQETP